MVGKGVVFHQVKESLMTHKKLLPYGPDIAPSDYYLFKSLQKPFMGIDLASREACENHLSQFLFNKDKDFFEKEIMK